MVAIIVVLTALLFPVFASSKTQAKLSGSVSNLSQIGSAIALYSQDNNDQLPYATDPVTMEAVSTEGYRYGPKYDPKLSPQLVSEVLALPKSIFRAPFDPGPVDEEWLAANLAGRWLSYSYAEWPPLKGLPLNSFPNPAEKTLMMETRNPRRNPRMKIGKVACLRMDLHVQLAAHGVCITQFPEPADEDLLP